MVRSKGLSCCLVPELAVDLPCDRLAVQIICLTRNNTGSIQSYSTLPTIYYGYQGTVTLSFSRLAVPLHTPVLSVGRSPAFLHSRLLHCRSLGAFSQILVLSHCCPLVLPFLVSSSRIVLCIVALTHCRPPYQLHIQPSTAVQRVFPIHSCFNSRSLSVGY